MGLGCESTCLSAFLTRRQHGKSHWKKIQSYINGHRDLYCNPGSCWSNSPVFSNLWIQSVQERSASSVAPLFPFFEITIVPQCPILKKEKRLVDSINIFLVRFHFRVPYTLDTVSWHFLRVRRGVMFFTHVLLILRVRQLHQSLSVHHRINQGSTSPRSGPGKITVGTILATCAFHCAICWASTYCLWDSCILCSQCVNLLLCAPHHCLHRWIERLR